MTFAISMQVELRFASIDGFLAKQREIVADIRRRYDCDADETWESFEHGRRHTFASPIGDAIIALGGAQNAWRRAWWLHAIGGRASAPFNVDIRPEYVALLLAALARAYSPYRPPRDRPEALRVWWAHMTHQFRVYIAQHTSLRIDAARERLAIEGVLTAPEAAPPPAHTLPRPNRKSRRGVADRQRILAAESECIVTHQELSEAFVPLNPVCGACTAESGGCCSLTVPLIWREADFRLLAMSDQALPEPSPTTPSACPFLGSSGCRLPSERRPHICRVFLCDKAEEALADRLPGVRESFERLTKARSRLG